MLAHPLLSTNAYGHTLDLGAQDGPDQVLAAEWIRSFVDGHAQQALTVIGARIEGALDLEAMRLDAPLILHGCESSDPLILDHVTADLISITSCRLDVLSGEQLETRGTLDLSETTAAAVSLIGARVGGQLVMSGVRLAGGTYPLLPSGTALRPRGGGDRGVSGLAFAGDGLTVAGSLVCDGGFEADGQVRLVDARVDGNVLFDEATLRHAGAEALLAEELKVGGSMWCWNGFAADGEISFRAARIAGMLGLSGARIHNPRGTALGAELVDIGSSMICRGLDVRGMTVLSGHIGGNLLLDGARLSNPSRIALHGDLLRVDGSVALVRGFAAQGEVRLVYSKIGGALECQGAELSNEGGRTLFADGAEIGRAALLNRVRSTGELRIASARIGGSFEVDGAVLVNPGDRALNIERLEVRENLFGRAREEASPPLQVRGLVDLTSARIGGALELHRARLINPGADCLFAERLFVESNAVFSMISAEGLVRLGSSRVNGQLVFTDAELIGAGERSLSADRVEVGDDAYFDRIKAERHIGLTGARVAGALSFDGAELGYDGLALDLSEAHVGSKLTLRYARTPRGGVDLTGASLRAIEDDPRTWPARLRLRRCEYDDLRASPDVGVDGRLEWLRRDPQGYVPEPYEQLISHYRRHGQEVDARRVAIARERRRREVLPRPWRVWNRFLEMSVGYGYTPWKAGAWLLVLLAAGTIVFAGAYPHDLTRAHADGVRPFQPLIYTLDVMVPVVNLHQRDEWVARGYAEWVAFALTLSGWLLTTALVAGVTGVLKRS
jgi:hypothetical protein